MSTTLTKPAVQPSHVAKHAASVGVSFGLALDQSSYTWEAGAPRMLTATMTLRCADDAPLTLTFPNSQQFDIAICDATGKQVALWSAGQAFADHVTTLTVKNSHVWTATMALPDPASPKLDIEPIFAAATYTATAHLTAAAATAATPPVTGVMQPMMVATQAASPPPPYAATVSFGLRTGPVVLETAPTA